MTLDTDLTTIDRKVNVRKLCKYEQTLTGVLPLACFQRLVEVLPGESYDERYVELALQFSIDRKHQLRVKGRAVCSVGLLCQRCLIPFQHKLDVAISLVYFESESDLLKAKERERLPNEEVAEPIVVEPVAADGDCSSSSSFNKEGKESGAFIDLSDLIEDDLLLALPQVPKHPVREDGTPTCPAERLEVLSKESQPAEAKQNRQLEEGLAAIKAQLNLSGSSSDATD